MLRAHILFVLLSFIGLPSINGQSNYHLKVSDITFEELIHHLESEFALKFAYSSELVIEGNFTFDEEATSIKEMLQPIWDQVSMDYQYISDDKVLIRPKPIAQAPSYKYHFRIIDAITNDPLDMVAISLAGTNVGVYSDPMGTAILNMSQDNMVDSVELFLLGYHSIKLRLDDNRDVSIALDRADIELDEIIIQDRSNILSSDPSSLKQQIKFSPASLKTSGVTGADILRTVQLLAGITAHNDKSAGLQIRGSDEDKALILMDGIPIYNPTHYYGVFSAINASYIEDVSIYKNNLPIEYGGKTSGMLQLKSKDLNDVDKISGVADINLLTSSLVLQFPLADNVAVQFNGRTTYNNASQSGLSHLFTNEDEIMDAVQNFSIISREGVLATIPDYRFNDWNTKLHWAISDCQTLELNYYASDDLLSNDYANSFRFRQVRQVLEVTESYMNEENWSNRGASINWNNKLNEQWDLSATGYLSSFQNTSLLDASISRSNNDNTSWSNAIDNSIDDYGGRIYSTYKSNKSLEAKIGIEASHKKSTLDLSGQQIRRFQNDQSAQIYSIFASSKINLSNNWLINGGLRLSNYSFGGGFYFSPRINIAKYLNKKTAIKASAGRQYQFAKQLNYETPQGRSQSLWVLGGNPSIPINRSNNVMAGLHTTLDRFTIDIEFFYKETDGINEYAFTNSQFSEEVNNAQLVTYQLYSGINKNYGGDLTIAYTGKSYGSYIAYTLSKGVNSFREIAQGEEYPSQEDRRHQLKWINNYSLQSFSFNLNTIYSSGRPYTDLLAFDLMNSRNNIRPQDRIRRLPHYFRVDAGVDYTFRLAGKEAALGLSIYNVSDRTNVSFLQYIFSVESNRPNDDQLINTIIGTETGLLPRTINLSLGIQF